MHEMIAELLSYLQGAVRYKWWAVLAAWLACLSGWVYVSQLPDQYKASARVHVDTRTLLRPLLTGLAIQPDVSGQVRLMTKLMFSRPNLEKVARMTDLDLNAKDEKGMEAIVKRLNSSMSINSGGSSLFTIDAEDEDPKLAKRLVQALLTIFVEETLGESRKDSDSVQRFLDQQIKEYEMRLQAAEKARENFKREHYGLLPGQGGDLYSRLQQTTAELENAKLALQEALNRRDEIQRQLKDGNFEGSGGNSPLDIRIKALQARIDELRLRYTEHHPDIIAAKNMINNLEKEKRAALKSLSESALQKGDQDADWGGNPIFQQMKIALGEAEANVASLSARVKNYQKRMEQFKEQMDARLKVETELKNLNRDYAAIRGNYDALLERREKARLSENVEQNTDSVKFRVVDPPQVPSKPSAPNRILLSVGVLLAGVAVGIGLMIFLALLRPTFSTTQKVREVTGLPLLGTVSMNWIPAIRKRKWREFLGFCTACVLLLAVFAGILILEIKGVNLHSFKI